MCVIQIKTTEQFSYVVLFIVLYKVVLSFKSLCKTLACDHSNVWSLNVLENENIFFPIVIFGTLHNCFYFCIPIDSNFAFIWQNI